jgi:hypothetical protein
MVTKSTSRMKPHIAITRASRQLAKLVWDHTAAVHHEEDMLGVDMCRLLTALVL